jgi:N-acetylneuraminic acid mutarotase
MTRESTLLTLVVLIAGISVLNNRAAGATDCLDDTWAPTGTDTAPGARNFHTAVWTGSEMIVWGGAYNDGSHLFYLTDGSRYDPATDTWMDISTEGAPSGREGGTVVWTDKEMIIWGGTDDSGHGVNAGGRYDPATDTWVATSTVDAPGAGPFDTAVWTGKEMLVWNGATGGRYDPGNDTWAAISPVGAPSARGSYTAVWTGNEMIIWGGGSEHLLDTGGRYDPATDTWMATSTVNAPRARDQHTAIWDGSGMIVWGGNVILVTYGATNTGGRYDPATDTWSGTPTGGAPSPRALHKTVWTGTEMVVWGGGDVATLDTGGRYNPLTSIWAATSQIDAPSSRSWHTMISTGREVIVWGGFNRYYDPARGYVWTYLNTGGRYCTSGTSSSRAQRADDHPRR